MRLLRLFRVMRVLGIATRLASRYPEVFRRGLVEYFVVCGLLVTTVIFGTVGLMFAENSSSKISSPEVTGSLSEGSIEGENSEINERLNLEKAFWFSVYSLFAGEPIPEAPKTVEGAIRRNPENLDPLRTLLDSRGYSQKEEYYLQTCLAKHEQ